MRAFNRWRPVQIVEELRIALPVLIFLFVVAHQFIEVTFVNQQSPTTQFTEGVLIYGLIGPLVTWWVLTWIADMLRQQEQAEEQIRRLNRELEERVAQRTHELQDALQELRDRADELERANQELTELDQLKSEFVSMVSHELRAPLTNMAGSVELLINDGDFDPRQRLLLEIIGEQTQRLTRLVQGILNVSRIASRQLQVRQEELDLDRLTRRMAQNLHSTTGRVIEVNLPAAPLVAWADADRVEEVLTNLLDNALKYSPPDAAVGISGRLTGDEVVIGVSDAGVGIPADQLERIFEKFHRVERGDNRETYGHGLGLYIARGLVEALNGRIWAESAPGQGATFYFTLPRGPVCAQASGEMAAPLTGSALAADSLAGAASGVEYA